MKPHTVVCYNCSSAIQFEGQISRTLTCQNCSCNVKCCLNCTFYEPNAYNECREPQAERITNKELANFCSFFEPNPQPRAFDSKKEAARKKLEELFRKKGNL